ncbi:HAMP domain-containing protein, partial [Pseudomonas sp. RW10S2]
MTLRQRLENLPVGQKLLAALLVLLVTILLVANLAFISAAYWITQESMAPQALQTIGRLVANPQLSARASDTPETASALLKELDSYSPLRAAAVYASDGRLLAQLQHGQPLSMPKRFRNIDGWRLTEFRSTQLIALPRPGSPPAHLLLVASSELPVAFYTGTLSASLAILVFSILLWLIIARQIKRLITQPINRLEELSRQVTREESYALRAQRGNDDEIGSLAEAFNTMLSRIEAREDQLKRARDEFQSAFDQAQGLAEE